MAPVVIAIAAGLVAAGGWYELRKKGKKAPPASPPVSAAPPPPPKASAPKASAPAPKTSAPSTPAPKAGDPAPAPKGVTDPFAEGAKGFSDKPLDAAGGTIDQTMPPPDAEPQTEDGGAGEEKSLTDKASDALKDLAGGLGFGG